LEKVIHKNSKRLTIDYVCMLCHAHAVFIVTCIFYLLLNTQVKPRPPDDTANQMPNKDLVFSLFAAEEDEQFCGAMLLY
jgi:hypothetical protein